MVKTGRLTQAQADDIAAGKQITDPATGAIIWMTPQGLVGRPADGGPTQPIRRPQAPVPAPPAANAPIPAPSSPASSVASGQPMPARPSQLPQDASVAQGPAIQDTSGTVSPPLGNVAPQQVTPPSTNISTPPSQLPPDVSQAQRPAVQDTSGTSAVRGGVQLTPGKQGKLATESEERNLALYHDALPDLQTALENWDSLGAQWRSAPVGHSGLGEGTDRLMEKSPVGDFWYKYGENLPNLNIARHLDDWGYGVGQIPWIGGAGQSVMQGIRQPFRDARVPEGGERRRIRSSAAICTAGRVPKPHSLKSRRRPIC